jgi:hypothetical protein
LGQQTASAELLLAIARNFSDSPKKPIEQNPRYSTLDRMWAVEKLLKLEQEGQNANQ